MKDSEIVKEAEGIFDELVELLGVEGEDEVSIKTDETDEKYVSISISGDDMGGLIGYRGSTLNALQLLFSQMLYRKLDESFPVLVDVNGFRKRRKDYLKSLARRAMEEAKESGQEIELPPLSPFERRIVHISLKDEEGVKTESKGEGEDRHIVVKLEE